MESVLQCWAQISLLRSRETFPITLFHLRGQGLVIKRFLFHVFPQAIVFIVGGGNYIEYQNLMDYSKVSLLSWNNKTRLRSPSYHETPVVICMLIWEPGSFPLNLFPKRGKNRNPNPKYKLSTENRWKHGETELFLVISEKLWCKETALWGQWSHECQTIS